jgi:endo-alpha-1,4-polygalactosaminidase (GH114 family)
MPRGEAIPQNEGTVTAAVDIILTDGDGTKHEIHVKFNDAERLIGLQGGSTTLTPELLSGEVNKKWPSAVQYKHYRNQFAKKMLNMEQAPEGKSSYQVLQDKGEHRKMITNKEVRKMFLSYLRDEGLPGMILDEVKAFFLRSKDRKVYFFKYKTKPNPAKFDKDNIVSLSVSMLKANPDNFGIVENFAPELDDDTELTTVQAAQKQHALSTRLYTITYDGEPVFVIEARSGSHPMQLKLFSTKTKMENIYDEVELNIGSA